MINNINNTDTDYIYQGFVSKFLEQLKAWNESDKPLSLDKIPTRQEQLPRNKWGLPRIAYYGGFTPWTNIPIANKNGGTI